MLKKLFQRYSNQGLDCISLFSVGLFFNDKRMSYVLLRFSDNQLFLHSYRTIPLEKGLLLNSKIIEMDALSSSLIELSKEFSDYTDEVVVSLPQSFVTIDYFQYNHQGDESLEVVAEYKASKIGNLDEINFDYFLFEDEEYHNAILTVAKKSDVDSRVYLAEISNLKLAYLDIESVARANAFSYWINKLHPKLENEVIAIFEIDSDETQVLFTKKGRVLYTSEINIGSVHLINKISAYANVNNYNLFNILRKDFEFSHYELVLEEINLQLIQEISRSIKVFYAQNHSEQLDVTQIFLTGIGAKNFRLNSELEKITGLKVLTVNPVECLPNAQELKLKGSDAFDLTVALGLALRGL